jgi:Flp pilus assembly protein TadD
MLRLTGRFIEAQAAFERSLELAPKTASTLANLGLLMLDMGRLGAARHRFLDAVDADPSFLPGAIHAAIACFECGDLRRAEQLIPPRERWDEAEGELRHDLAMALIHVGRTEDAEQVLDPRTLGPGDGRALARLAMLRERTNRLDEARALLDRVRGSPHAQDADLRSDILTVESALAMRAKDYSQAQALTEELLATKLPGTARASALFTLGAIADKQGREDAAMKALAEAHAIHFALAAEIVPAVACSDGEPLQIATRLMRPEECAFAATHEAEGPQPVFIVGFPRSGTTMLEQMLDAHPSFVSMDEQPILQRCIEEMQALGHDYPHQLDRLAPAEVSRMRAVYWEEVARVIRVDPGQTLVDKNPLNLLRLPAIRRLFPAARIILALRHPCDVLLSCYMQNFRSPAFMVLCSSLERLAKSYVNSMQSWIHHERLLKPDVLQLRYEETVADFPAQVQRIAEFLRIEDREPLARFSEHAARKGYISTPSYSQVIEPVNTRAVARWHAYRRYFEPVYPILRPVAEHWGYDFA